MNLPFTGGCVCGAVRYESSKEPLAMFNCHCQTCQKSTGSAYTPVIVVRSKYFKITKGKLSYYFTDSIKGGSGNKRGFCGTCGSRVTGAESDKPQTWLGITASSLDDPSWFRPAFDIFTSHAHPWDQMDPALPKHTQYPPPA